MDIANSRLSPQVLTLEEAQSLIRIVVKDELFLKLTRIDADEKVKDIIRKTLKNITIPALRDVAWRSLVQFYNTERRIAREIGATRLFTFLALSTLLSQKDKRSIEYMSPREAKEVINKNLPYESNGITTLGQPLDMYHEKYMNEYIKPVLDRMAREQALDPDAPEKLGRRMSLLSRAEIEVRYDFHKNQISELREKGIKLVIVSSHADCSKRCLPWQNRVYSLDGTYGIAPDGRKFIPLEIATNILTPNGKWYNGLFGFNCRHTMREYNDGLSFPNVSPEEAKTQYRITQKQRRLEREIRRQRADAQMLKGIDDAEYSRLSKSAQMLYRKYKEFSKHHHRAYFTSRTKIV